MHSDARDRFLKRVVKGKSFADVGGLWGVVNERLSVAHEFGASEVTMIDVTPEGAHLWTEFRDRMKARDVTDYRCVSADICALDDMRFDVVHCSGVLYHHPDPLSMLVALRRASREHLILTSVITQREITNQFGTYRVPASAAVFVPALDDRERSILGCYWREVGAEIEGIHHKVDYHTEDFGPWLWLPTENTMVAMCEAAGLGVIDAASAWNDNAYTLLLDPAPSSET